MRRATAFAALALVPIVLAGLPLLAWFASAALAPGGSSAAPLAADGLTCTVRAGACVGSEVEVLRMSSTTNAHAGTPAGAPGYTYAVCCAADGLGTSCSGTHETVLALSGAGNAHVATTTGGAYTTEVCLSAPTGTLGCSTDDVTCGTGYACLAAVSGSTNAQVAGCDGADVCTTKVCCSVGEAGPPPPVDTDGDAFGDKVECYLPTDSRDNCPDVIGSDDAWPLDIDMTRDIDVTGDVFNYVGRIGATGGQASDPSCPADTPMWWQRLDLQPDCAIDVTGDVFNYVGKIGMTCT